MAFPVIVVQEGSKHLLEEIGVKLSDAGEGYYTADSVESASKLISSAIDAGARLFNTISVEDVVIRENRINGVVINSSAIEVSGLHVDPLAVRAKYVIDGTGHPAEVVHAVRYHRGRKEHVGGSRGEHDRREHHGGLPQPVRYRHVLQCGHGSSAHGAHLRRHASFGEEGGRADHREGKIPAVNGEDIAPMHLTRAISKRKGVDGHRRPSCHHKRLL
jgi:hypothetical protein